MRHGVIVLNDPDGLSRAMNKMYFQLFPEEVRPRTVITRDRSWAAHYEHTIAVTDQGSDVLTDGR